MRWRWRNHETTPSQAESDAAKDVVADEALREARTALRAVRQQKKDGSLIANVLADIRAENHFKDMWNQGMRGE
jgi:hypothetical protein